MRAGIPTVTVLGVPLAVLHADAAVAQARALLRNREPALVAFVDARTLNIAGHDEEYRRILRDADLVLGDGLGPAIAARLGGGRLPASFDGTTFTPRLLAAVGPDVPVFLLGGRPGVADRAADTLAGRIPGLSIAGTAPHPGSTDAADPVAAIRRSGARILVLGMESPCQERWLVDHLAGAGATIGVAAGALLDVAAGTKPRPPLWARRARLEPAYRLGVELGRQSRHYLLDDPTLLGRVIVERSRGRWNTSR